MTEQDIILFFSFYVVIISFYTLVWCSGFSCYLVYSRAILSGSHRDTDELLALELNGYLTQFYFLKLNLVLLLKVSCLMPVVSTINQHWKHNATSYQPRFPPAKLPARVHHVGKYMRRGHEKKSSACRCYEERII